MPLRRAYEAMPEPRLVAALGDCAMGCGVLAHGAQLAGPLEELLPVDMRIPGCPPSPQQIAEALLALMREGPEPRAEPRDADEHPGTLPDDFGSSLYAEGAKHA